MKYVKTGRLDPNVLESELEVQPFERIQRIMQRLDCLLGLLKESDQLNLTEYVGNLQSEFQNLILEESEVRTITPDLVEGLSNLYEFPELANLVLHYYLKVLQIQKDQDWINIKIRASQRNEILSFLHPRYYSLSALIKTIGREEAVKFYKRHVTRFLMSRENPNRRDFESAEVFFEKRTQPTQNLSPWVITHGILRDGKYFYRNENCLWIDALNDLPDSEIKYLICCYGDYQNFRYHHGDSIVLTMEHTIAQGDPYCSRVVHDTIVDWNLRHPPREFWDELDRMTEKSK